ncbi:MAG: hypothetical protein LBT18_03890 [Endomicrobium sp.]|jgi:predicted transcriptional regulator|nr:hypothetical protein [Endomicrobium sp.]
MCKILLSIKPEYVEKIFDNTKRYEYCCIPAKNNVDSIIIYCTYPVKKIVGGLKIKSVLMKPPITLWKMTRHNAGISKDRFYEYFNGKPIAYAYEIESVVKYRTHKDMDDYGISFPHQSFVYFVEILCDKNYFFKKIMISNEIFNDLDFRTIVSMIRMDFYSASFPMIASILLFTILKINFQIVILKLNLASFYIKRL